VVNAHSSKGESTQRVQKKFGVIKDRTGRGDWKYADPEIQGMLDQFQKIEGRINELQQKLGEMQSGKGSDKVVNRINSRIERLYKKAVKTFEEADMDNSIGEAGVHEHE